MHACIQQMGTMIEQQTTQQQLYQVDTSITSCQRFTELIETLLWYLHRLKCNRLEALCLSNELIQLFQELRVLSC